MKKGQRLLYAGYSGVLRTIVNGDATWHTVEAAHDINRTTAQRICHGLHDSGLMHIERWINHGPTARSRCPVYAFGAGEDAPCPSTPRPRHRRAPPIELLTFINAIKALLAEPHHGLGLSNACGLYPRSTRALLAVLRKHRLIYIDHHEQRERAGAGVPMWAWGVDKKNKAKPKPMTRRELWEKHNAIAAEKRRQTRVLHLFAAPVRELQAA